MTVKYLIESNRSISYSGVLATDDVQKILDTFFMERSYDRYDIQNRYLTTKKGRLIELETRYEKQYSDDDIFECTVYMTFADIVPIEVTVEGKKKQLEKGRVSIRFETYLRVNETGNWSGSPIKALMQYIGALFIFRHHFDNFKKDAKRDIDQLYDKLLHFLNGGN